MMIQKFSTSLQIVYPWLSYVAFVSYTPNCQLHFSFPACNLRFMTWEISQMNLHESVCGVKTILQVITCDLEHHIIHLQFTSVCIKCPARKLVAPNRFAVWG